MFKDVLIVQQMAELIDKIILYSGDFDTAGSFVSDSKSYSEAQSGSPGDSMNTD
jgi:hypothetical protein